MSRVILIIFIVWTMSIQANERLGQFHNEQICKAGIATNNGRDVKTIYTLSNKKNIIKIAYERLDDGKVFIYACKISGNEIKWMDPYTNKWSRNLRIFYSTSNNGQQLDIWTTLLDEKSDIKSFKKTDFN